MISVLISFVAFLIIFGTAGFLWWFWWAVPRDQVPPHLNEAELKRLEVQDRLRQTSYQILTALGLGATLLATLVQAVITTQQWSADYEQKAAQVQLTQYADAIKTIDPKGSATANVAGITTLQVLAAEDPKRFHQRANEVLVQFISEKQEENHMVRSSECGGIPSPATVIWIARNEAPFSLQIAMGAVGHAQFARNRLNFTRDQCARARTSADHGPLILEHKTLDNLNLSGMDFSCAKLSQSRFHRSSFAGSDLRRADLRGAQLADFRTPDFLALYAKARAKAEARARADARAKAAAKVEAKAAAEVEVEVDHAKVEDEIEDWLRHRCLHADFKYAKLNEANFEGAVIAGANFREADVTGANFCRADISRVDFTNAKGLTAKQLKDACVGPSVELIDEKNPPIVADAQPKGISIFGKNFRIPKCHTRKECKEFGSDW